MAEQKSFKTEGLVLECVDNGSKTKSGEVCYNIKLDNGTTLTKASKDGLPASAGQKVEAEGIIYSNPKGDSYWVTKLTVDGVKKVAAKKSDTASQEWKPDPLKAAVEIARICLNDAVTLYAVPNIRREDKDGNITDYSSLVLLAYDKFVPKVSETVKKLATEL